MEENNKKKVRKGIEKNTSKTKQKSIDKKMNTKLVKKVIIICFIVLIILISTYFVINYFINKNKSQNMSEALENIQIPQDIKDEKSEKSEKILKLQELQKENSEIVGWLEIEGTNINYPVLQGKDNSYYMTHTYKKEYSADGSLFLDKDYDFSLPSTNLLIYGHNNLNDTMFCDLMKYKDETFYKEHPTISYITSEEECTYEIISVFLSRVYYKSEKNVFRYYFFINANNEKEFNDYVTNSKNASLYDTGKTATYGDSLMTLSTCSYHTDDGRLAVVARKVK